MKRIAIFASGGGSNARRIIEHLADSEQIKVALIVTNRSKAGVLTIAEDHDVPSLLINKSKLNDKVYMEYILSEYKIDFIALAGFLMLIPEFLVESYENRMVNIHPSLLPSFKGLNTHQRAIDAGVKVSGCTVHFVSPEMDEGPIISQAVVAVNDTDTEGELASRILIQEHKLYPEALALLVKDALSIDGQVVKVKN